MTKKNEWRFPGNNYTDESGLDTSDMETFKKDPIASLAREICQNSIDAKKNDKKPVVVEFKLFEMNKEDIPGADRILQEIKSCKKEWSQHTKISTQLESMELSFLKKKITVLRASDFNTKGLVGVASDEKKPWYLLTKGSGISDKGGTSGGSKGIGKFASFVASEFNTVFYNTRTIENEVGYQGICKLCSTSIENTDEKTQGIGYYGRNDKNKAILEPFSLDKDFKRGENDYGTDIYIIAFRNENTWIKEIITKILDSFMAAIIFGDLEVTVQDIEISQKTIKNIVYSNKLILKNSQKNIISQYILLTDEEVYKEHITIDGYGDAKLYIKSYSKNENYLATNSCVMIRYPYMKIKTKNSISSIPCSAMCIIGNNDLNKTLRELENPQHTDWEIKRITDTSKRKEIHSIIRELYNEINQIVSSFLSSSDNTQTDIEGASDYLPENGENENYISEAMPISEKPTLYKKKKNTIKEKQGYKDDDNSIAFEPEIGSLGDGDDVPLPDGHNSGTGGDVHPGENEAGIKEGDSDVLKYTNLSGFQYRFFVLDKKSGKFAISFISPVDEKFCEMEVNYVDDGGNKYPVDLFEAMCNGVKCEIKDNKKILFELFKNKKYKFELVTNQKDLFAGEVKIYARR